jgi:putative spermidine/putrescine transport system substrate-binding protein
MGKQKKIVKFSICLGLMLVFVFTTVSAYAAGLSAEEVKQRLEKFRGKSIVLVSWGGSFQEAQRKAMFQPFEKEFGIKVIEDSPSDQAKIRAMVKTKNVTWDCVDLGSYYPDNLGRLGYLEPIDYSIVDKTEILPKFAGEYHVGTITYSTVMAYRTDVFPEGKAPTSTADFWNVEKFPGRRSLYDNPMANYTYAMTALGYPPDKVYPLTDEKIDKIYKKMDEVKPHVTVWWTAGAQPAQLLTDKEVVMASAWNGRVETVIREGAPIKIVWAGAALQGDSWVIPKGTKNKELAMLFIAWQALPEVNWRTSKFISYGPINKGAFDKVDPLYKGVLPSDHVPVQVQTDFEWWSKFYSREKERWNEWKLK